MFVPHRIISGLFYPEGEANDATRVFLKERGFEELVVPACTVDVVNLFTFNFISLYFNRRWVCFYCVNVDGVLSEYAPVVNIYAVWSAYVGLYGVLVRGMQEQMYVTRAGFVVSWLIAFSVPKGFGHLERAPFSLVKTNIVISVQVNQYVSYPYLVPTHVRYLTAWLTLWFAAPPRPLMPDALSWSRAGARAPQSIHI